MYLGLQVNEGVYSYLYTQCKLKFILFVVSVVRCVLSVVYRMEIKFNSFSFNYIIHNSYYCFMISGMSLNFIN